MSMINCLPQSEYEALECLPYGDMYNIGVREHITEILQYIGFREWLAGNYIIVRRFYDKKLNCWVGIRV